MLQRKGHDCPQHNFLRTSGISREIAHSNGHATTFQTWSTLAPKPSPGLVAVSIWSRFLKPSVLALPPPPTHTHPGNSSQGPQLQACYSTPMSLGWLPRHVPTLVQFVGKPALCSGSHLVPCLTPAQLHLPNDSSASPVRFLWCRLRPLSHSGLLRQWTGWAANGKMPSRNSLHSPRCHPCLVVHEGCTIERGAPQPGVLALT